MKHGKDGLEKKDVNWKKTRSLRKRKLQFLFIFFTAFILQTLTFHIISCSLQALVLFASFVMFNTLKAICSFLYVKKSWHSGKYIFNRFKMKILVFFQVFCDKLIYQLYGKFWTKSNRYLAACRDTSVTFEQRIADLRLLWSWNFSDV